MSEESKKLIYLDDALTAVSTTTGLRADTLWALYELPTFEERPKGKWIEAIDTDVEMLECSACESRIKKRNYADSVGTEGYNYCPYCGADMRGDN